MISLFSDPFSCIGFLHAYAAYTVAATTKPTITQAPITSTVVVILLNCKLYWFEVIIFEATPPKIKAAPTAVPAPTAKIAAPLVPVAAPVPAARPAAPTPTARPAVPKVHTTTVTTATAVNIAAAPAIRPVTTLDMLST